MAKRDLSAIGIRPQHTFDKLVVGPHNQIAAAAGKEVARAPGEAYNPLFLYGSSGVGKTHLMQAIANAMFEKNPNLKAKYISSERFTSEVISAVAEDAIMALRKAYSELDLFILDDVQFLMESKATQGEFFHIFNNLHQQNRQVVMAADCSPGQLQGLDQTIRSRLEWGLAVDVKVPDVATRVEILKLKQELQGLQLNPDVLLYVADVLKSNVRELEGFLKRLHAYVTLSHQELTMELVKHVVKEILPIGTELPTTIAPAAPSVSARAPVMPPPSSPPVKETIPNGAHQKKPAPEPKSPAVKPHAVPVAPVPAAPPPAQAPPPPAPPISPTPAPVAKTEIPELQIADFDDAEDALPSGHKEIMAVFFYPASKEKELETVHRKFQEVIKKHKLKFRLKKVYGHPYEVKGKVNYSSFVDVCKEHHVPVAIVIGPPPDTFLPEQDFYDLLSVTLDVQGVSLQLVNWAEIDKDYRYLNLALDIALVRTR